MSANRFKSRLFKIYCWYDFFDDGNFSVPPYTTLMLIGNTLLSIIIIICMLSTILIKPNRISFYGIVVCKILLISYLILVWVMPFVLGIVLQLTTPYKKLIFQKEFVNNEDNIRKIWKNRPVFFRHLVGLFLAICPYFLFFSLLALFELVINV